MQLRGKFSVLLGVCVVVSVVATSWFHSRRFILDQKDYVKDLLSILSTSAQKQIETQVQVLYSNVGPLVTSPDFKLKTVMENLPAAASINSAQLWEDGKLVQSYPELVFREPIPAGTSATALVKSPVQPIDPQVNLIRWLGRYGNRTLAFDFKQDWLGRVAVTSHGATVELVAADGSVLYQLTPTQRMGIRSEPLFDNAAFFREMMNNPSGLVQTREYYGKSGVLYLVSFLKLNMEPPVGIVVKSPLAILEYVIERIYREAIWVALPFVLIAILIGILFASHLTAPLREMVIHSSRIAGGDLQSKLVISDSRQDEIGTLARAFNHMTEELKKLREQVRKSERLAALGTFSSSLAHEIKNPLGIILGHLHMASQKVKGDTPVDPAPLREDLQFAQEETKRANSIIMRLLKFSRSDKTPVTKIDLRPRLVRSLALVKPLLDQNDIQLIEDIADGEFPCMANGDEIHEVIVNLVQNAIDAMKGAHDRRLWVSLAREESQAVMKVRDSGQGMDESTMKRIFEPFFTTKEIGQGTGLGLAVCHGIITNHRGQLFVQSEVGKGTEFKIKLPLENGA